MCLVNCQPSESELIQTFSNFLTIAFNNFKQIELNIAKAGSIIEQALCINVGNQIQTHVYVYLECSWENGKPAYNAMQATVQIYSNKIESCNYMYTPADILIKIGDACSNVFRSKGIRICYEIRDPDNYICL